MRLLGVSLHMHTPFAFGESRSPPSSYSPPSQPSPFSTGDSSSSPSSSSCRSLKIRWVRAFFALALCLSQRPCVVFLMQIGFIRRSIDTSHNTRTVKRFQLLGRAIGFPDQALIYSTTFQAHVKTILLQFSVIGYSFLLRLGHGLGVF